MNTQQGFPQQGQQPQGFPQQGFQQPAPAPSALPSYEFNTQNHHLQTKVVVENGNRQSRRFHVYDIEKDVMAYPAEMFAMGVMASDARFHANQPRFDVIFIGTPNPNQDPSKQGRDSHIWSRVPQGIQVLDPVSAQQYVHALVQQHPGIRVRATYNIPAGSKFQSISCIDAQSGQPVSRLLYSEQEGIQNDMGYLGYYLKSTAPITVHAERKQGKVGRPFWALSFRTELTDDEIFQQGGSRAGVYGDGMYAPTNTQAIHDAVQNIQPSVGFSQGMNTAGVNVNNFAAQGQQQFPGQGQGYGNQGFNAYNPNA